MSIWGGGEWEYAVDEVIINGRGTAGNRNDHDGELSRRVPTREQFQEPVKGSIPTIIRSYKSAVSYRINLMRGTKDLPVWQRNYGACPEPVEGSTLFATNVISKTKQITLNPMLWGEDDKSPLNVKLRQ